MNRIVASGVGFLRVHFYVALGFSAFLLSLGSALVLDSPIVGLALMASAGLFGWFGVRARSSSDVTKELAANVRSADAKLRDMTEAMSEAKDVCNSALEAFLGASAAFCGLGADERVTVYVRGEGAWQRLGRFSDNLLYMRSGRDRIPLRQGVVHEAHVRGEFSVVLEDVGSDQYFAEQRSFGITKVIAKAFAMPVRSYVAFGLARPGRRDRDIVVVFESLDEHALEADALKEVLNAEYAALLVNLCSLRALLDDGDAIQS